MGLLVEQESLVVDLAVEMNRQLGNAKERSVNFEETRFRLAFFRFQHHPPGEGQVAVRPGRQQHTAVHLDTQLQVAGFFVTRVGFEPQVGTVRVRPGVYRSRIAPSKRSALTPPIRAVI